MSRHDIDGFDIGNQYQLACIDSWQQAGFYPISVNSQQEIDGASKNTHAVCYKSVNRDAGELLGKPLIFVNDMLNVADTIADGPVAIANADILLMNTSTTLDTIRDIKPGQCLVIKRFDIESMESKEGIEDTQGYDFFAFHSTDIPKYTDTQFIFGVPWWDHYFPLRMAMHGIKIMTINTPFAFHLNHNERWDPDLWVKYGLKFAEKMKSDLSGQKTFDVHFKNAYADPFANLIEELHSLSCSEETNKISGTETNNVVTNLLSRLATLNFTFIDNERVRNTFSVHSE